MTTIYDDCSKEELLQIVSEMQTELKYRKNENNSLYKEINRLRQVIKIKDAERIKLVKENKELQRIINDLQSDLVGATNDYKQAVNEVKLLNKQCDKLIAENNDIKHRRKIFVKHLLNIMYGFDYADTNSIKETKDNDSDY